MENRTRSGERGLALVSVLWGLSILSLIAAAILAASVLSSHLERNEWDAASRRMTEDAALNRAVLGLLDPRPEKRWRVDGASQIFEFQGTKIRISIEDELGKIDLNTAGDDLIRRLFHSVGLPPDEGDALTDRVLDWRAPGVGKRLNGADERDYRGAGLSYRPRGGAFQSIDELKLVLGMTAQLFVRLEPVVTVYSQRSTIDPQFASRAALLALPGMDDQKADDIISARGGNGLAGDVSLPSGVISPSISLAGRAFTVDISFDWAGRLVRRKTVIRIVDEASGTCWVLARE